MGLDTIEMKSTGVLACSDEMAAFLKRFSWSRLLGAVLHAFGVLWLIVEVVDYFFSELGWSSSIKSGWWLFCLTGLSVGGIRAWPRQSVRAHIEGTDVRVEVRIGDIFKLDGAIVLGSNTTFDTAMEDNTISISSVQGQFSKRYFTTITELDQKLDNALNSLSPHATRSREEKPYGKHNEYELGTVAPIEVPERKAYFVAVARLNSERVASTEANLFLDALPLMWNGIRQRGGMESLLCPVLGSGFSRLKLTRKELTQAIIRSFVVATQEGKLSEKLTIVIRPDDVEQGHISLEDLRQFLEYECIYARVPRASGNSVPTGIPIQ